MAEQRARSLDALLLIRGVREVAGQADPENPAQVSQRRFDAARKQTARYGSLPLAKDIAHRLRLPWREVLLLAHTPTEQQAHRLGRAQSRPEQDWLTPEQIAYVLRVIAARLKTGTLTPAQYRDERARMLALSETRWLHGRRLRLPTDDQIRLAAGDWDHALVLARLAPRLGLGDQGHGKYAPSTADVLERAYEAHGTELTSKEIWTFVKANGIPYGRERGRLWAECVAEWKQQRTGRGLDVPAGPPPLDQRPDYTQPVGAALPGEQRRRDWSDLSECLPFIIAYLEQLPAGARSTRLGYADWARTQTEAPAYSCFDQHGGWERLRTLAYDQL
jgi:hypothetical protein